MTEEYIYAQSPQQSVWKRTVRSVVDSEQGYVQTATVCKTVVEKEMDQPDYDSEDDRRRTCSIIEAQGENDQPNPANRLFSS